MASTQHTSRLNELCHKRYQESPIFINHYVAIPNTWAVSVTIPHQAHLNAYSGPCLSIKHAKAEACKKLLHLLGCEDPLLSSSATTSSTVQLNEYAHRLYHSPPHFGFYQGPVDRLWVAVVKVGTIEATSGLCMSKKAAMADASQSMLQLLDSHDLADFQYLIINEGDYNEAKGEYDLALGMDFEIVEA